MVDLKIKIGSLFAGVGGIELGFLSQKILKFLGQ